MTTGTQGTFKVWEGVYSNFAEASVAGLGFSGETWLRRSVDGARAGLACLSGGRPLDGAIRQRNAILPTLLATLLSTSDRVRVLDFGGGVGFGYLAAAESVSDIARVDYHIVEVPAVCHAGRTVFSESNLTFHEEIPQGNRFDVVYVSSALQYIADWRSAIETMLQLEPNYLLLSDVLAGDLESFVTLQNYYESRIPCWVLNLNDLIAAISERGFSMQMKSAALTTILGQAGLPMDNFPAHRRVSSTLHLMFSRQK